MANETDRDRPRRRRIELPPDAPDSADVLARLRGWPDAIADDLRAKLLALLRDLAWLNTCDECGFCIFCSAYGACANPSEVKHRNDCPVTRARALLDALVDSDVAAYLDAMGDPETDAADERDWVAGATTGTEEEGDD